MGKQLSTNKRGEHPFGGDGEVDPRNRVAEVGGGSTTMTTVPLDETEPETFDQAGFDAAVDAYMTDEIDTKNVDDTLTWVDADEMRARVALEREQASEQPRKGVVEPLTKMLADPAE